MGLGLESRSGTFVFAAEKDPLSTGSSQSSTPLLVDGREVTEHLAVRDGFDGKCISISSSQPSHSVRLRPAASRSYYG